MPKQHSRSFRLVCEDRLIPLVEALLHAQGYAFEPEPFSPLCRRLCCEPRPLGASLAAFFGYIYIQDRSSMLPPLALAPRPGEAVLDVCASPGSKSGFLAQLTGPTGFVLANEPTPARLGTLRANLHQCNLLQAATCSYNGENLPLAPASWNAIQLDPPCSGWGTAEKHPRVLKLWQGDKLNSLTGLQQRLLRRAASLLAPGGRLVYSTCTTNEAENEAQVRFAEEELGLVRETLPPFPGFVWEERSGGAGTLRVDGEKLVSASKQIYGLLSQVKEVSAPEELRGLEGVGASAYFSVFDEMILGDKETFSFQGRSRRPPLDAVNAMLSFAYSLLAHDCASALESVGLDSYVGFLHRDRPGRTSLALDLMEELRPCMADRFVLTLINNRQVKAGDFQYMESGAVLLAELLAAEGYMD